MTSIERAYALYTSVRYIIQNQIPGAIVECGVWKGGSVMIVAYTLITLRQNNRELYLYDTFAGMSQPENVDRDFENRQASTLLKSEDKSVSQIWGYATEAEVQNNLRKTHYDFQNIHFIKGMVEKTIPKYLPKIIALLRLDTDWYSSTYHELKYLYPILARGGVLILDDYGHWQGSRKAVNQYFRKGALHEYLHRIDYTGRLLIKK